MAIVKNQRFPAPHQLIEDFPDRTFDTVRPVIATVVGNTLGILLPEIEPMLNEEFKRGWSQQR